MSLDSLNQNLATLTQQYEKEYVDSESVLAEDHADNPKKIDIQVHIQTNRNVENSNANANEVELLEYDRQLDLDIDVQGQTINEKFSSVVEKLRLQRISQIKPKRPGRVRAMDLKFQATQAALLGAINCQLDVNNFLLSANVAKDVLTICLDGIPLAITAKFGLNQRRHEAIRPHFKSDFAKGLCSTTSPADKFLFGGDTAKRVKEMAELKQTQSV